MTLFVTEHLCSMKKLYYQALCSNKVLQILVLCVNSNIYLSKMTHQGCKIERKNPSRALHKALQLPPPSLHTHTHTVTCKYSIIKFYILCPFWPNYSGLYYFVSILAESSIHLSKIHSLKYQKLYDPASYKRNFTLHLCLNFFGFI